MLVCKGYIISEDENTIYETPEQVIEIFDKNYNIENCKLIYYATYNDGDIAVDPLISLDEVLQKCKDICEFETGEEKNIVITFKNEIKEILNFYDAYNYLYNHPIFNDKFLQCLDIEVVKINPETKMIDDNELLNTRTEIWLECGPYQKDCLTHDLDLDCGGFTFEEAIIKLANLVRNYYGDDKNNALKKVKEKYN